MGYRSSGLLDFGLLVMGLNMPICENVGNCYNPCKIKITIYS